eukprot:TRINITY_DN2217_c0_g1_i1.p1 TRINITY_DN2217_c0_g1~~TRINITY_DN2217_c0_g1_i1.p1  ORF type:complete len:801 (-),score=259.36 TRINITY_DN2217_c0_g1_i1:40-2442(-)
MVAVTRRHLYGLLFLAFAFLLYNFWTVAYGPNGRSRLHVLPHDYEVTMAMRNRTLPYVPPPRRLRHETPPTANTDLPQKELEEFTALYASIERGRRAAPTPIEEENARPGTTAWMLTNPAMQYEIEGYASLTSVNKGSKISFFVGMNLDKDQAYDMIFFRMGWYGGTGGRQMLEVAGRRAANQSHAAFEENSLNPVECDWTDPYELWVPTDWMSGFYLVQLTAVTTRKQAYILFIVRDDEARADFLVQHTANSYQAYNNWGPLVYNKDDDRWSRAERSAFEYNSGWHCCRHSLSFARPYLPNKQVDIDPGVGAGEFMSSYHPTWKAGWEYNFVRWIEKEGYSVKYCSSQDVHSTPAIFDKVKAMLVGGRDEFWTREMRQNAQAALRKGVSFGFFATPVSYYVAELAASTARAEALRTVVLKHPKQPWREPPVNSPEGDFIGTQLHGDAHGDMIIDTSSHWLLHRTDLKKGSHVRGMIGYVSDAVYDDTAPCIERVAHSPVTGFDNPTFSFADTTVYQAPSRAWVFSSGSSQWVWGLDDFLVRDGVRGHYEDPQVQQMTRNVLARFAANRPGERPTLAVANDDFAGPELDRQNWCVCTLMGRHTTLDRQGNVTSAAGVLELLPTPVPPPLLKDRQVGNLKTSWYTVRMSYPGDMINQHTVGVMSRGELDLKSGKHCPSVRIVQPSNGAAAFGLVLNARQSIRFEVRKGELFYGPGLENRNGVRFDPALHAVWRFRYDAAADSVVFETSPAPDNGKHNWSRLHAEAVPFDTSRLRVELHAAVPLGDVPSAVRFSSFRLDNCS